MKSGEAESEDTMKQKRKYNRKSKQEKIDELKLALQKIEDHKEADSKVLLDMSQDNPNTSQTNGIFAKIKSFFIGT